MFLLDNDYWKIRNTKNKGRGVFAKKPIAKGTLVGDYVGKLIPYENVDFDKEKESLYLMYFNDDFGIYPSLEKPGTHLLNHSCFPNCWIYKLEGHAIFFALTDIQKGEELTISYLLSPKGLCTGCSHKCYCNNKNCIGSMHLDEQKYKIWQDFQDNKKGNYKIINENKNELKPLLKYPKRISESYILKIKQLGII